MAFRSHSIALTSALASAMLASSPLFAQPESILPAPAPGVPVAPPAVAPPLPVVPPQPLPRVSESQAVLLRGWLADGARQGLTSGTMKSYAGLSGDALVRAALDRATALRRGRVDTADFLQVWALRPAAFDPLPGFTEAVRADRLPQWTNSLTPRWAGYDGLRVGLAKYEKIRDAGGWKALTAQSPAADVRARLKLEDDAVSAGEPLSAAIQRAQRRYGLEPTGTLGARTLAALNVPVRDRVAAIMANMERWRWLPAELPVDRVQVNIAAAVVSVFEGDKVAMTMRGVTGSVGNETPMLTSTIHSIVVNPPWNVPTSIAKKELWPKGRAALARQGYKIVKTPDGGERIVQPAGPGSALGRLKFDFDNPFAVYLHDTPSRAKFSSYDRLASHGCIRLERPVPLADRMLEGSPALASATVQDLIDTGKTQRVSLPKPVSVYLLYWTAFASANGTLNFRDDPYGWDKLLADKIDASTNRALAPAPGQAAAPTIASKD
ncbi:L,D-transpeptidase family protein [Sphingobium sufflavum]|uniref:L,D-transpeptidase family protein n=1 Tax=Sphingobium sufflavum TaxID=1129547 RepID=UPI001F00D108|nr:L,D-transpeptidase family protein [Sphingobium sufflavum]MCE7796849.1 L,D-transpeptidase family protein [Sphingobium sufflavum]